MVPLRIPAASFGSIQMSKVSAIIYILIVGWLLLVTTAHARDSLEEAANMAEVFVYGRESKNEALLREISDPEQYEAMEKIRAEQNTKLNENVRVDDVEITTVDGDRVTAKATYSQIHNKGKQQAQVHLRRVDGKWQVTPLPDSSESE